MKDLIAASLRASITEVDGRVWNSSALGHGEVPALPEKPFILFSSMGVNAFRQVREESRAANVNYNIYVYQERGSYVVIDLILAKVRENLLSLVDQVDLEGSKCLDVVWLSESRELDDPELDANMRYVVMQFTSGTP